METLINVLAVTVVGVSIIGWLWIVVAAFSDGETLWGIGCLIISPLCLVYGFLNFHELKIPFLMVLLGFAARVGIGLIVFAMS
ncbi:hypothetical protein [Novipirellula artificiosorum]|uniref:Major facilitator superfamily (MFS) profile domain-containing protein n=1 Tax=Novipirellula artificiosorum TaxID=2528016 RepID=A0A5C6D7U0_9BACT|nr:hypothetical protein [Novipirellula artificiosorum]TWU31771.1 hypothetical protein Poly41_60060 [Novipirellula artificiosorum]